MKCVILAAGVGKRLRPLTSKSPKCLLPIDGTPLLAMTLQNLLRNDMRDVVMVTGYREQMIRRFVRNRFPRLRVTFVRNDRFLSTNNAFSLFLAREEVAGQPFLLLDSDILFTASLLRKFLGVKRRPNRLAVRVQGPHDREEIGVRINRWDHVLEIGKNLSPRSSYGESIGIEFFSSDGSSALFDTLARRMKSAHGKREFYEASFQEMIDNGRRIWAVDIGDEPTAEIDTPEDLIAAEKNILPLFRRA